MNLYDGDRRDFFFYIKKRERAEEVKYYKCSNFQAKKLLLDRILESFILRSTKGAIPNYIGIPLWIITEEL
jgi:hypothetical protein